MVHLRMQKYDEAASGLKDGLAICASSPSPDRLLRAAIVNNMALCHQETGRYEDAVALLREVREVRLAVQGDRNPDYEQCLFNLACTLVPLGRIDEALELFER